LRALKRFLLVGASLLVLFWFHENLIYRVYLIRVLVETAVRVKGRDSSGRSRRYVRMRGLPHSDEPGE